MTNDELIHRLLRFPRHAEVMILDGANGGGCPRDLNLGPVLRSIGAQDADAAADCEDKVGSEVVVLGFGCY